MNRTSSYLLAAALLLLNTANVFAQDPVKVTVSTEPTGATFYVDGTAFSALTVFTWPKGSKHTLSCVPIQQSDPNANNGADFNGVRLDIAQSLPTFVSGCTTWTDNSGVTSNSGSTIVITADPSITAYKSTATILYKVILDIVNGAPGAPVCGSPGDLPVNQFRPGLVIMNGQCYWNTTAIYMAKGPLTLNAYPYPGFVFDGWSANLGQPTQAYLRTYDVQGPVTIGARFSVAKRVRFFTDPPLFDVTVDGNRIQTASANPCPTSELQSPAVPFPGYAGQSALCRGDLDFAFGSTHTLGAPTPQTQGNTGQDYVFDSFSIGGKQGTLYTPSASPTVETIVAKFVKAARVSFVTTPVPLALTVDGKSDWSSYNFIWAYGSTYTVTAPAETFDANGRKYVFVSWSNGKSATQSVTVDPTQLVSGGIRLIANYQIVPRAIVQTTLPGAVVKIDGADCPTPCTIDRPAGTQVTLSAPRSVPVNDVTRYDFVGWQDGVSGDRSVSFNTDIQTIKGNFALSNKLTVVGDPAEAGILEISPSSPDGFYPAVSEVHVTSTAKPGFKFRRYEGDIQGTNRVGSVIMTTPRIVRAMFDKVPFIAPAGVRNAAADTTDNTVAAGSLVSIYGVNLAPAYRVGPSNPLAQTINGVVAMVADRALPLIYVSPDQINAKLPDDLDPGTYTIVVRNDGQPDVTGDFTVVRNAPGLFINQINNRNYVLAFHEDGTVITPDSPARRNEVVNVLGTGFGPLSQKVLDGFPLADSPLVPLVDPVTITAGGLPLTPVFTGGAAGFVGVNAVKFRITSDLPTASSVDLKITSNGRDANVLLLPLE